MNIVRIYITDTYYSIRYIDFFNQLLIIMNTIFRKIILTGAILAYIFLNIWQGIYASAATTKKVPTIWIYTVYLTHPTTKQVTVATKWIEKNKIKALNICKSYIKTQKNYGIQCIWNNLTIFSKKRISPTTIVTTTTQNPVVIAPVELKTFDGYIDGRIIVTSKDISKEKSIETCTQMKTANPKSEIMCRWGDTDLGTFLAQWSATPLSIELIPSSIAWPTNRYLTRNMELEIGRFSLKSSSGDTDTKLNNIIIKQVWSARIRTLVDSSSNARLIDIDSGKEIYATVVISDTDIIFGNMDEALLKNSTRNFKIVLGINSLKDIPDGTSVALSLEPGNIKILKKNDFSQVLLLGGVIKMTPYNIWKIPPKVAVTNINENKFRIRITNNDENYPIYISDFAISTYVTLPSGQFYSATACIRNTGSSNACGWDGTSNTTILLPGSNQTLTIVGSSVISYVEKNGGYTEFDIYASSPNIFPTGGQIDFILEGITYTLDGKSFTEKYPGETTARAKYKI